MTLQEVLEEIKFELTGGVLELELSDIELTRAVEKALRELERFWDETTLVTLPFSSCIDLTNSELDLKEKVSSIVKVYRTDGYGDNQGIGAMNDPLYAQQWMLFSNGGTMYNLNDYCLNYAAWQTLLKIKNTMSTDMSFKEDRHNNKLYINQAMDKPNKITIEYIPKLLWVDRTTNSRGPITPERIDSGVQLIQDDYWIDILVRLSVSITKMALGRIRTRFTQGNAIWSQDGEKMLEEGTTEYKELREVLRTNSNMVYPID